MRLPCTGAAVLLLIGALPVPALAWGYEGHEIIAAVARGYLTPAVRQKVDALLAADPDSLTARDMVARATWADAYRSAGHRETADWHFVDIELDRPDMDARRKIDSMGAHAGAIGSILKDTHKALCGNLLFGP